MRVTPKTHRLAVTAEDGVVMLRCDRGDLDLGMGAAPTPDDIAKAAADHWGKPSGWWS